MTARSPGNVLLLVALVIFSTFTGISSGKADAVTFGGARPFKLFVPSTYNAAIPEPLILALHGFASSGDKFEKYLNLTPIAEAKGILYAHPDGTADKRGTKFWNATPECCDFQKPKVDDDAYLMSVIDQISQRYTVDPERIYIIGHSNGGFMVNRMACNHSDRFAAVVNIAGGTFANPSLCKPKDPINYLEIWGTSDVTYKINHIQGRTIMGAVKTVDTWASLDRCSKNTMVLPPNLDLDRSIAGTETTVTQYLDCPVNTDVEFWSIKKANHVPKISQNFTAAIVDFLLAHPRASTPLPGN